MNINECMLIKKSVYFDYAIIGNFNILINFNVFPFVKNLLYLCVTYLMFTFMRITFISNLPCLWCLLPFIIFINIRNRVIVVIRIFEILNTVELYIIIILLILLSTLIMSLVSKKRFITPILWGWFISTSGKFCLSEK